ncbi:hypothetical protein SAMN06265338_1011022 [Rhodoblastus acidophilus]|uniref:PepSY domain-containing protein n=1 Tax=Rhodoblastus acidophilus TaxID=1074 RepID=A0A212QPG1_RHOAC|nr:PepSY domain-containing protein [Rhodoblastus acidophilus]PPQ34884.1 hypothetical protein CKO16_21630 [Rhodoblastus acidophilus]SNB61288.1 hypothetical protein SAMN06265338_1011022 [Rhodoblastus acidophilus]
MGGKTAILCCFLLGVALALAAVPARAQGIHGGGFGGGGAFPGLRFGGPRFDGPRFDGPLPHDAGPAPRAVAPPLRDHGPLSHDGGPPPPHEPAGPPPREPMPPPPPELAGARKCFSPAETRARVAQSQLLPPFTMLRRAANLASAQALGGRLCRWADLDVYDISLLRPDGRVVHVFLDASTGDEVSPPPHKHEGK